MIILSLNGEYFDLKKYGLSRITFEVDSLTPRHETEIIEGRNGHIDLNTTFEGRTMRATFLIQSSDFLEYTQLRNEIYKLFDGKTYFYLIDSLVPNKRWKVRTVTRFTPEMIAQNLATLDIELISPSPFAESVNMVEYIYNSNFSFNNIGDEIIDMREQNETEIEFVGSGTNLTIRNKTTGDEWMLTGSTVADDVILLKGIRSLKNGNSIIKQTNKKIITFAPGWNEFEILGASNYSLSIRTRFYFI